MWTSSLILAREPPLITQDVYKRRVYQWYLHKRSQGHQMATPLLWHLLELKHHCKKKEWLCLETWTGTRWLHSLLKLLSVPNFHGCHQVIWRRKTSHPASHKLSFFFLFQGHGRTPRPAPYPDPNSTGDRFESKPTFLMSTQCLFKKKKSKCAKWQWLSVWETF